MYTVWPGQFMMTAMRNTLKKINRTVLEMDLGILFLGVLAQIIGAFIANDMYESNGVSTAAYP